MMLTLILLLQISLPSLTLSDADLEVEVLEPLKSSIEYQLEEGNVRVIEAGDMIALNGSAGEEMWGVPRLVESTKGTVLTLQLIQPWLPATRLDLTVADFNNLAFHLGFVEVEWEASCDAINKHHTCRTLELVFEFLLEWGTVPEGWPTEPEVTPPGDDEWAVVNRRAW